MHVRVCWQFPELSLVPFVTGWMGKNHFAATPTAIYVTVALMWLVPDRRIESIVRD